MRVRLLILPALALLAACQTAAPPRIGPDGLPLPQRYNISANDEARIQTRAQETINALRAGSGAPPLALNPALNQAAAVHSRDMSVQARPWVFGSDGSTPPDRAARAGYGGRFLAQAISETYETELETIAAWMESPDSRAILLDPAARDLGFSFYQEPTGKIWWTLMTGG